ncbi:hypothetical protein [Bosea sp. BK604]|uniref:hypothetical protein n=1 Tax=Bosea sp. BK604 TaxID=2512180 RepID=UPI001045E1CF|nr:hypothetical protein [Bosea sp. BK604]TCR69712.1 hypothetical protein EV560_101109 [Bosea sp. BK604]
MRPRRFQIEHAGKRKRSAARGMAKLGFPALVIAIVLKIRIEIAREIVACRNAPAALWSAAELALFRENAR